MPLLNLLGGEPVWGDRLDALRPPRQPGQALWQWRQETGLQPVVFQDPQEVNADRVQRMRGFQGDALSRTAVLATTDDTAKLIVLARLHDDSLQQQLEATETAALALQQHLMADVGQLRDALDRVVEERRQLEDNRRYWKERIRRTFAPQTPRVEPAGAIDLGPREPF